MHFKKTILQASVCLALSGLGLAQAATYQYRAYIPGLSVNPSQPVSPPATPTPPPVVPDLVSADFAVSLSGSTATKVPGATGTLTLTVTNLAATGSAANYHATWTTNPTAGRAALSFGTSSCVASSGSSCAGNGGALLPGGTATFTLPYTVAGETGTMAITASVAAGDGATDTNGVNDTATQSMKVAYLVSTNLTNNLSAYPLRGYDNTGEIQYHRYSQMLVSSTYYNYLSILGPTIQTAGGRVSPCGTARVNGFMAMTHLSNVDGNLYGVINCASSGGDFYMPIQVTPSGISALAGGYSVPAQSGTITNLYNNAYAYTDHDVVYFPSLNKMVIPHVQWNSYSGWYSRLLRVGSTVISPAAITQRATSVNYPTKNELSEYLVPRFLSDLTQNKIYLWHWSTGTAQNVVYQYDLVAGTLTARTLSENLPVASICSWPTGMGKDGKIYYARCDATGGVFQIDFNVSPAVITKIADKSAAMTGGARTDIPNGANTPYMAIVNVGGRDRLMVQGYTEYIDLP